VWSLGVILVNLTCGRNPWKRASTEDTTFRAYLKDPEFLRSILPVSPELNVILHRIFECDPYKRITIPELRRLILECPRFTMPAPTTIPTAPTSRKSGHPEVLPPYPYYAYAPIPRIELLNAQYSGSAVSDTSLTDNETISSVSSDSDYASEGEPEGFSYVDPQASPEFWNPVVHMPDVSEKNLAIHLPDTSYVRVIEAY
jgi:hypothetical protein